MPTDTKLRERLVKEFLEKFGNTFDYTNEHEKWWLDKVESELERKGNEIYEYLMKRSPTNEWCDPYLTIAKLHDFFPHLSTPKDE